MKNLILFGLKNSGKTTLGKKLSDIINYNFIDTDILLEELYLKKYNSLLTYKEIHKKMGEPFFRELEKEAVCSLHADSKSVISLGGGTAADISLHPFLQDLGNLFYLKIRYDTFLKINYHERYCTSAPLFMRTEHSLKKIFDERTPIFELLPARVIKADDRNEGYIIKEMLDAIK